MRCVLTHCVSAILDELQRCGFSEDDARSAIVGKSYMHYLPIFILNVYLQAAQAPTKTRASIGLWCTALQVPPRLSEQLLALSLTCHHRTFACQVCKQSSNSYMPLMPTIFFTLCKGTGPAKVAHSRQVPGLRPVEWS